MRYTVTADVPEADRSDVYLHNGIVDALLILITDWDDWADQYPEAAIR